MRNNYGNILKFLLLVLIVSVQSYPKDIASYETFNVNSQCDSYCMEVIAPLIQKALDAKDEIEKCDNSKRDRDEKISELQQMITNLQFELKLTRDELKHKDDMISSLEESNCADSIASYKEVVLNNTNEIKLLNQHITNSFKVPKVADNTDNATKCGKTIAEYPVNCVPFENSSAVHEILVPQIGKTYVKCDSKTAGSGWLMIQHRFDGSVNFYRNWSEYRKGFGSVDGEFFIGLEKLHQITNSERYELYIELQNFYNDIRFAHYDNFLIGSENQKYSLSKLGSYYGNAGNALSYNLNDPFTTYDQDNDSWQGGNCAQYYTSAGWFNYDGNSNLNGEYYKNGNSGMSSIWWHPWEGYTSRKSVKMMIRPLCTCA